MYILQLIYRVGATSNILKTETLPDPDHSQQRHMNSGQLQQIRIFAGYQLEASIILNYATEILLGKGFN